MTLVKTTEPTRDLSDFRLFTASCECRFDNAYQLWDRAGAIWSEFSARLPGLRMIKADPGQTVFRLAKQFEFNLQLDRYSVNAYGRSADQELMGTIQEFSAIVAQHLQIERYSRIGLRPIFFRSLPDVGAAAEHILALNLVRVPPKPSFGISGTPEPRYLVRLEDKSKGCLMQIYSQKRELKPDLPFAWEGEDLATFESVDLAIDVDYYTIAAVTIGQINLPEWIKQAMHVIRRDVDQFLKSK